MCVLKKIYFIIFNIPQIYDVGLYVLAEGC